MVTLISKVSISIHTYISIQKNLLRALHPLIALSNCSFLATTHCSQPLMRLATACCNELLRATIGCYEWLRGQLVAGFLKVVIYVFCMCFCIWGLSKKIYLYIFEADLFCYFWCYHKNTVLCCLWSLFTHFFIMNIFFRIRNVWIFLRNQIIAEIERKFDIFPMLIGSETSLWPGLSVGRSVGCTVGRSVITSQKGGKSRFHAPNGALVHFIIKC